MPMKDNYLLFGVTNHQSIPQFKAQGFFHSQGVQYKVCLCHPLSPLSPPLSTNSFAQVPTPLLAGLTIYNSFCTHSEKENFETQARCRSFSCTGPSRASHVSQSRLPSLACHSYGISPMGISPHAFLFTIFPSS